MKIKEYPAKQSIFNYRITTFYTRGSIKPQNKVPCLYNGNHLVRRVNEQFNIYTLRNHKFLTHHSGTNHGDCAAWKYF